ncbi:Homocysteine S-methyltransferase, partial [Corchorus capsularis]
MSNGSIETTSKQGGSDLAELAGSGLKKLNVTPPPFPLGKKILEAGLEPSLFVSDFLAKCGGYGVVDGGFATELERHGQDLNDPLWSAKCLISSPHLVRR